MKRNITAKENAPIEIYGDSIVLLHKVLKEEDLLKSIHRAEKSGEEATVTPVILIDFSTVTSIQEDYKRHGTIIMDNNKTAVIVKEPLADVLDVWCEIKERLANNKTEEN